MVLIGAACGATLALGLVITVLGIRGTEQAGAPRLVGPRPDWLARAAVGFAAAIVLFAFTRWPVGAVLAGVVATVIPDTLRRMRAESELVTRTEAVAAWTEMIRYTLAAAAGFEEAVLSTRHAAPEAIREEVDRLGRRLRHGQLVDALERFADEVANPAADLVVAALATAARREARELVPLLTALATSARAEAEMRMRVHVSRARIRTAVRVVIGTLGLFAGGLIVFNRPYLAPYGTAVGQLVLFLVGGIVAFGWWLLQRMAHIQPPERFLDAGHRRIV